MSFLRNPWLSFVARIIVGGVYAYASLDKIIHPDAFATIVHNYHILPDVLINIFAVMLPWIELTCGLALILGTRVLGASTILSVLTAVFIAAVSINVARGVNIDCGCFSTSSHARKLGMALLLQDAGLLLLALHVLWRGAGRLAMDSTRESLPA
jgi:cobalt-zinc-cadmium efflux system protein